MREAYEKLQEKIALLLSFVFWFLFQNYLGKSIYTLVRSCWMFLNLFFPLYLSPKEKIFKSMNLNQIILINLIIM